MTEDEYTQDDIDAQLIGNDQPDELDIEIARENAKEAAAKRRAAASQGQATQAGQAAQTAAAGGTQSAPIIGAVPGSKAKPPTGSIPSTRFASEYKSTFSCEAAIHDPQLLPLLAHVNCSYLSTYANSPTLTDLKQHVQSLIVLIKGLTITTNSAYIDNANLGPMMEDAVSFHDGETYDFLNDLNNHYDGPETKQLQTHHGMPLNAALNTVEIAQRRGQTSNVLPVPANEYLRNICPMLDAWPAAPNQVSLPYAKHESLIKHANEILELLDHEYSAKGGLLSILPPKEQEEDRKQAETTILGQLILHMQRLVIRCHDLERLYANATDAMASEAVIPAQTLSRLGPDGRKGRELVYPQDRFVLVNCGEDVYSFLSNAFDRKDIQDEEIMRLNLRNGATGEALWRQKEGREYSRGITALDVVTRYYRIRGDEKAGQANKTIFIIPAHAEHPGVKVTREMEQQPTVVAVVKPQWPERQSIMEMKNRSDLKDFKILQQGMDKLMQKEAICKSGQEYLLHQLQIKEGTVFALKEKLDAQDIALNRPEAEAKAALLSKFYTEALKKKEEAEIIAAKIEADKEAAKATKTEADDILANLHAQQKHWDKELTAMRAQEKADRDQRVQKLRAADEESARVATELEAKLQGYWQKQIQNTQVLIEHLKAKNIDAGNDVPSQNIVDKGEKTGANAFNSLLGGGSTFLQPGHTHPEDHDEETSGFMHEESDQSMGDYDCCTH
ncbi:hypothetical protein N431DRAFT_409601 [Stipitochalara longipes BDJ]|nr:hypothetical protein N431DRAFT_409601 [Stipitochalara longipes BDJ]